MIDLIKNKKVLISLLAVVFVVVTSSWYAVAKVKNKIEDQQNRISKLEANNMAKQAEEIRTAEEKKKQEDEAVLLSEQQKIEQSEQEKKVALASCENRKKECPVKIASSKQAVAMSEVDYKKAKQKYERDLKDKEQECKDKIGTTNIESLKQAQEQKCELESRAGIIGPSSLSDMENKLSNAKEQLSNITKDCTNYQNPCL
ncbi:MAG: hypothetical protein PHW24_01975 [Candidatus Moranbacteria bacterium]|nr:hypothetical protein [Candidatus Moranbacteria bacterium]